MVWAFYKNIKRDKINKILKLMSNGIGIYITVLTQKAFLKFSSIYNVHCVNILLMHERLIESWMSVSY